MTVLTHNERLRPEIPAHRALLEVGGEWIADPWAEPSEVIAEARARGVRALKTPGKDIAFVRQLPELEFLSLGDCGDVSPALELSRLRGFQAASWDGTIDANAWPMLERFAAGEPPRDGGGVETAYSHPRLRSLGLGRFLGTDLAPITAPRLEELNLAASRLESLSGIEQHADTLELLSLDSVPKLASLRGVEALARLEVLAIEGARLVTTLEDAAKAPALRLLDIFDQKGIESLAPLAGHPTLEFVTFQRTGDMSLDALFEIPNLRMVLGPPRSRWNRDIHDLPFMHDIPEEDPRQVEYTRLRLRY